MIQRIQTIYLLLAVVLSVACLCMQIGTFSVDGMAVAREYNLWVMHVDNAPEHHFSFATVPLFVVLLLSAALGLYSIFAYRNRITQARFCVFNMLLVVGWYILYAVYGFVLIDAGGNPVYFAPSFPAALPAVAFVFHLLARRGIMADERLVRAADRIR